MSKDKQPKKDTTKAKDDLKGFDIKINEFGEIITSVKVDKVNEFLDENVDDKKLKNRIDEKSEE